MRAVIQRVSGGSVVVEGEVVSQIGKGLVCLIGVHEDDQREHAEWLCKQIVSAKLFEGMGEANADKRWRSSVKQNGFEILLVSQFTLSGRVCSKGKVDFAGSMPPAAARAFYDEFVCKVRAAHAAPALVKDGVFGAKMAVSLVNDGPITVIVDSNEMPVAGTKERKSGASNGNGDRGCAEGAAGLPLPPP